MELIGITNNFTPELLARNGSVFSLSNIWDAQPEQNLLSITVALVTYTHMVA